MSSDLTGTVAREIHERLTAALAPERLVVRDDSERHRGHGGYRGEGGESHFTVEIVSPRFAGLGRVQRQRAVNDALRDLLADQIHALAIRATAPGE